MRTEDGQLWLTPDEWKIWVMITHPELVCDSPSETPATSEARLPPTDGAQEALFEMENPYAE